MVREETSFRFLEMDPICAKHGWFNYFIYKIIIHSFLHKKWFICISEIFFLLDDFRPEIISPVFEWVTCAVFEIRVLFNFSRFPGDVLLFQELWAISMEFWTHRNPRNSVSYYRRLANFCNHCRSIYAHLSCFAGTRHLFHECGSKFYKTWSITAMKILSAVFKEICVGIQVVLSEMTQLCAQVPSTMFWSCLRGKSFSLRRWLVEH